MKILCGQRLWNYILMAFKFSKMENGKKLMEKVYMKNMCCIVLAAFVLKCVTLSYSMLTDNFQIIVINGFYN